MNSLIYERSKHEAMTLPEAVDWLLSIGIIVLTTEELVALLKIPGNHLRFAMEPFIKKKMIITPFRGFWMPVSSEDRKWGAPKDLGFFDTLMRYAKYDYFLSWMTAAEIFGVFEQKKPIVHAATAKAVGRRKIGRTDFKFTLSSNVGILPTFRHDTQTGAVNVTTRAATMLNVAHCTSNVSGLNNAVTILIRLSETDEDFISELAAYSYLFPMSVLRRIGWVLENFTDVRGLDALAEISQKSEVKRSCISTRNPVVISKIDKRWSLSINDTIKPSV